MWLGPEEIQEEFVHKWRTLAVSFLLLLAVSPLLGASFIVPTDRELVDLSKAIVIATAETSYPIHVANGFIDTVFEFRVEEVIKGEIDINAPLRLVEMGGNLDGAYDLVPDSPRYAVGERALIFVGTNKRGENTTWGMILGKFNFVRDLHGRKLLLRGADEGEIFGWDACDNRHEEPMRSEVEFLTFVRAAACGGSASANYIVPRSEITWRQPKPEANSQGFHADDYQDLATPGGGGLRPGGIRWQGIFDQPGGGGSVTWVVVGTQAGIADPLGGIDRAMGAWNGDGQSNVNYIRGAASGAPFANDGIQSIHLDDSTDVPAGATGFARADCSGPSCNLYAFDGAQMAITTNADVAVKPGLSQSTYEGVLTHELGHTLSIRHSNQRTPSTSSAAMNSVCCPTGGAILATWDHDAVSTIYNPNPGGGPPPCTPPGITVQPQSQTINSGQSAFLSVTATGTMLSYQWYVGATGNTASPIAGATSSSVTVSPTSTTQYWVRVTGQCAPTMDSSTATVTVSCTAVITAQPVDQQVTSGGTANLSVSFTSASAVTVTWYQGIPPNTSNQAGTGTPFTTAPITSNTNFWGRLTNACGNTDTRTVTVSIAPMCVAPSGAIAFASPPAINAGQQVTLQVSVSGTQPLSFQWFRGNSPDQSNPISGATAFTFTDSPSANATYWVRVTNSCGFTNSNTVAVTVTGTAPCVPANITTHPQSVTINFGASTTLSVTASGTNLHYAWFQGTTGQTGIPVGTDSASFTTPVLTSDKQYWVQVTSDCGIASSFTATVTVRPGRRRSAHH